MLYPNTTSDIYLRWIRDKHIQGEKGKFACGRPAARLPRRAVQICLRLRRELPHPHRARSVYELVVDMRYPSPGFGAFCAVLVERKRSDWCAPRSGVHTNSLPSEAALRCTFKSMRKPEFLSQLKAGLENACEMRQLGILLP